MLIAETENYNTAIRILKNRFVKSKFEVYARHKLVSRNQLYTETIDEFLQALKTLSVDCNFQQVSAKEHRKQYIRDALVSELCSDLICQQLLKSQNLNLKTKSDKARALETASEHSKSYASTETEQSTSNAAAVIFLKFLTQPLLRVQQQSQVN